MPRVDAAAIARLRALHAASTKGKWEQDAQHIWADHVIIAEYYLAKDPPPFTNVRDAAFTAAAHNALPDLLADWEEAQRERKRVNATNLRLARELDKARRLVGRLAAGLEDWAAAVDDYALLADARAWSQPHE